MKNKKNNGKIVFFLIIIFVVILSIGFYLSNLNCKKYNCLKFPGINNWQVSDVYENTDTSWRGYIKATDYDIRLHTVKKVNREKANEFSKIASMNILGLFDTAKSPYPGAVSDKVVCPEEFKPIKSTIKTKEGIQIELLQSYLNNRMQYGSCSINQISYHVFSSTFYCNKELSWYQLELIVPAETAEESSEYINLFKEVSCKN